MRGTQNQFLFLPDQHSDFPFAVFAEDWGFLGCILLVALYGFLVLWAIRIAATAKDRFGAVLAIGVGALIFWHAGAVSDEASIKSRSRLGASRMHALA
jgi:rod shape determining protein RodA